MPMKRRFEIIPIVESEIVPDQSLELIKGGGYITTCGEGYSCEIYVNGHCSLNTCLKGYCYVCVGYQQVCTGVQVCTSLST